MPQENVTFQQLFEQGLASQQQKNWDAALETYQQALDKGLSTTSSTQLSAVYHNMSTIAYEKADFLKAFVWSKKAVSLDSGNQIAKESLSEFTKKFEPPMVARQISSYENLKVALRLTSVDVLSILALLLFFFTLWLMFKKLVTNKKNAEVPEYRKTFPWLASFLGLATAILFAFTIILWKDQSTLRGFIIAANTAVQTAPGENKPVIFEAQPGLEVEILQSQDAYIQVRHPGAFSGWIPRKNIEVMGQPQQN